MKDYLNEFIDHLKARGFSAYTLANKERHVNYFLNYIVYTKHIEDINSVTPDNILDYRMFVANYKKKKISKDISAGTLFIRLYAVKQYFDYLTERRYILYNPFNEMPLMKAPQSLPKQILSESEIARLIERPDIRKPTGLRDRAIFELLYSTGIRRKELVNLNVYDIDFQRKIVRINQGKGRKDRIVPLGNMACKYVDKYLKEVRSKWVKDPKQQALFISIFKDRFIKLNTIIRRYSREVLPGRYVTAHSFRHACATHMLRGGANIRIVQQILGHASILSTQVYTKINPQDLKDIHKEAHPRKTDKKKKK